MSENETNLNDIKNQLEESSKHSNSLALIDNFHTCFEKTKIPFKKVNYKLHLYKKRLKYGKLSNSGITNGELRILPALDLTENPNNEINLSDLVGVPEREPNSENGNKYIDEEFIRKLIYNSEMNVYIKPSRREMNLRSMLEQKISKLLALNASFKNNI